MFLTRKSEWIVQLMLDFSWIWRRSWAGFSSGFFGWIIVFIISRMIRQDMGMMVNNLFSGMICGVFLGTVGGIIEESGYKAFCGGILGTVGGALGGIVNIPLASFLQGYEGFFPLSVLVTWAIGGAFIGATSGVIERDRKKILAGIAFGCVGGALGGYLGSAFYGSAMAEFAPQSWIGHRLAEGLSGGLLGAILWFFIGIIEKLYIFRRREDPRLNKKVCDSCGADNPLQSWYCSLCGKVLQFAAPRQKIVVTPYRGIERITNAVRFLSWLFGVTGVITTPVIFVIFLMQNICLACISAIFSILFTYLMVVGFRFIGDLLSSLSRISSLHIDPPAK
ncbi:MAG: hypothetical protein ABSH12_05370 [Endomicrobiales bacterium]|jgi:ribosomal protein L40E